MTIKEEYELAKKLQENMAEVASILNRLNERNAFDNRGFTRQEMYVEQLVRKKEIRYNQSNSNSNNNDDLKSTIMNILEDNFDIYNKGYCVGWGEYLNIIDGKMYIDSYPWNFYGGQSKQMSSRREITQREALELVLAVKKKEEEKEREDQELEKERIREQEEFNKRQEEERLIKKIREETSIKGRLKRMFNMEI